jgi:hypothetical protein
MNTDTAARIARWKGKVARNAWTHPSWDSALLLNHAEPIAVQRAQAEQYLGDGESSELLTCRLRPVTREQAEREFDG